MLFRSITPLLALTSSVLAQSNAPPPPPPEATPGYPSPTYPPITNLDIKTGYLSFKHPSIPASLKAQTWYRIVTPKLQPGSSAGPSTPLVVLHGGPGLRHTYLQPTLDLYAQQAGRKVIYYDQFGGGNSTRYPASRGNTSFWTAELFMDELDNVLAHLLQPGQPFNIYGHSWGGMLATKYVAERQPANLNRLVFASTPAVIEDWEVAARGLLKALPLGNGVADKVLAASKAGDYNNQTYIDAYNVYNNYYLCRLKTWPVELVTALSDPDDTVHFTMAEGGDDFSMGGVIGGMYPTVTGNSFLLMLHLLTYI